LRSRETCLNIVFFYTLVTDENLGRIKAAVKAADKPVDIQTVIDETIAKIAAEVAATDALAKIKAYAEDQTKAEPIAQDFLDLGIADAKVTAMNVAKVNAAIAKKSAEQVDSKIKVEAIIGSVSKLEAFATTAEDKDKPSKNDFENGGYTGVTDGNLDRMIAAIKAKMPKPVDIQAVIDETIAKIAAEVAATDALAKIKAYAEDQTKTEPIAQDFLDLGIADAKVTAMNVAKVNAAIAKISAEQVDSKIKVEAIIDAVNTLDAYAGSGTGTNPTPPTKEDFDNGGYTGVQAVEK